MGEINFATLYQQHYTIKNNQLQFNNNSPILVKILDTPIPPIQHTNHFVSKKGSYGSFNSSNPFTYNIKHPTRLERGIIKETKEGTAIIS